MRNLYINGGPIITVQVENEYGSFKACDRDYTTNLRDYIRKFLGNKVVLFTTDGNGDGYLQCGKVPGVYATVDFGAGKIDSYHQFYLNSNEIIWKYPGSDVVKAFKPQRHFEMSGPRINSEYYPGWLDLWGHPHANVDANSVAKTLDEMLNMNASVSIYMFHGGTSFGLKSGEIIIPITIKY